MFLHKLLLPFLLAGHLVHPTVDPYTKMVDQVSKSVTIIHGSMGEGNYTCTGEVIAVHIVLTAAHCLGGDMMVDGISVSKVIAHDETLDLALLSVLTDKPALSFRQAPVVRFEELTALGHGFGWDAIVVLHVRAFLLHTSVGDDTPAGIVVQTEYIHGMSGGPLVDDKGLQVGIIQRGASGVGYGVDAKTIMDWLQTVGQ